MPVAYYGGLRSWKAYKFKTWGSNLAALQKFSPRNIHCLLKVVT